MDTPDKHTVSFVAPCRTSPPLHDRLRYEQGVEKIVISLDTGVLRTVLLATTLVLVVGCESAGERQAAQRARTEKRAAAEIDRICALPAEQREAELKKIQKESGVVVVCP